MQPVQITIRHANGVTEQRALSDGTYRIGREYGDIVLQDQNVSTEHATLNIAQGQLTVTDLGSTNGTLTADGRRLTGPYRVTPGESLRFGECSVLLAPQKGGTQVMGAVPAVNPQSVAGGAALTKVRGTVVKLPDATPGLLVVEGVQKEFLLQGVWRVAKAPSVGMLVDAELNAQGQLVTITASEPLDSLAGQGQQVATLARSGLELAIERMGKTALVAAVILVFGWFVIPSVSLGPISLSFWELLGIDFGNVLALLQGKGSVGIFSLLGLAAVAAPFAVLFSKRRYTRLLNGAPAALLGLWVGKLGISMVLAQMKAEREAAEAQRSMSRLFGQSPSVSFGHANSDVQEAVGSMKSFFSELLWDQISIGLGLWIVVIASAVLFFQVFRSPPRATLS